MSTVVERMRAYGSPLREVTVTKINRVRHYEEDEMLLLLDVFDSKCKALATLQKTIQQFENRSKEYLEIYQVQLKELEWFRSKYSNPYPDELDGSAP